MEKILHFDSCGTADNKRITSASIVSVNTEGDGGIIEILVVPLANRTSGLPRDSIKHIQHIQQRSPGNHGEYTGRGWVDDYTRVFQMVIRGPEYQPHKWL